jgi:hypothetical protein
MDALEIHENGLRWRLEAVMLLRKVCEPLAREQRDKIGSLLR